MTISHAFPEQELATRVADVREKIAEQDLDGVLISVPENIYYLTGLDHWGYFACHVLLVPRDGQMVLICRQMEHVTVERYVRNADFVGYKDDEDPVDAIAQAVRRAGLAEGRLGIEKRSLFLTPRISEGMINKFASANWQDCSGLVDEIRLIKSPLEIEYTRKAAFAADAGAQAGIAAAHEGASDLDIAAEVHAAMIRAGSEYPGFGPFIRLTDRLNEEHTTWKGDILKKGDALYLEFGASYRRYQAPMGRLVFIGEKPQGADWAADLSLRAMNSVLAAIRPGAKTGDVYQAWQDVVDSAGLPQYRRHHCGYLVGIGFPPSWTGGSMVTGLATNGTRVLKVGMVFHVHSWLMWTGKGDYFFSNTVVLTQNGAEVLTHRTPETLTVV
ncbi:MAG: M24 family metallopeptidase [Woeseiaceae bacterium]